MALFTCVLLWQFSVTAELESAFYIKSVTLLTQVLDLIPVSDSVTKLTANCAYCEQPALFSLRIAADHRQEVVGGADKYAPVCRHHYVTLSQLRRH